MTVTTYFPQILQGYSWSVESGWQIVVDTENDADVAFRRSETVGVGEFRAVPPWIRMWPFRAALELKLCKWTDTNIYKQTPNVPEINKNCIRNLTVLRIFQDTTQLAIKANSEIMRQNKIKSETISLLNYDLQLNNLDIRKGNSSWEIHYQQSINAENIITNYAYKIYLLIWLYYTFVYTHYRLCDAVVSDFLFNFFAKIALFCEDYCFKFVLSSLIALE